MARVVVHIPFHRMEVPSANRFMDDPTWWEHRAKILERFTVASLEAQDDQDFDVVVSLRKQDCVTSNPVVQVADRHRLSVLARPYLAWQYPIAPNQHDWFCERYNAAHWLIVLHLDGDDCYASDAVSLLRRQELSVGLLMWFGFGWTYGVNDDKLCWFGSRTGPPPFFAEVYDRAALRSPKAFADYRDKWGFECYHHHVVRARNNRELAEGKILQTIHGANSSQTWENPYVVRRIVRWIEDSERKEKVLARFGVER